MRITILVIQRYVQNACGELTGIASSILVITSEWATPLARDGLVI